MTGSEPPRYAPERQLPPYAYLPGGTLPHPTQNPAGHSYTGEPGEPGDYFEPDLWADNDEYLFGVDLYNHGFLWEAHEAWEGLWHQAKHDALQADFLQGLIQCAAASLKVPMEQPRGLRKLSEVGTGRLERVCREGGPTYMGIDLAEFVDDFRTFAASTPASADERPRIALRD